MEITSLIKSTKLKQLTKRLSISSLENIYEIADQGYFGLYVKPCLESQYNLNIDTHFNKVLKNAHSEDEKNALIELHAAYLEFLEKYPHLLVPKPGYERLATTLETKIWTLCNRSSINQLNTHGKIIFPKHATAFGFIKINNNIISNAYHLQPTSKLDCLPENYKGYYSEEDIYVFIDQIELLESELNNWVDPKSISIQHTSKANLPKVDNNRGKHHSLNRVQIMRYGIAVLLSNPNTSINGGKGIAYLISKYSKQPVNHLLGDDNMARLFNKAIKLKLKNNLSKHDNSENLYMIVLSVVFKLRQLHNEENFDDLLIKEAAKISNQLKVITSIDEINNILTSSALPI
jgi:hypothetical protein